MKKASDLKRKMECMMCRYIETCLDTIPDPEEYGDGTCRTKDELKEKFGRLEKAGKRGMT